ncbi:hypothetical protein HK099_004723, partial [Clydaea vesicula]
STELETSESDALFLFCVDYGGLVTRLVSPAIYQFPEVGIMDLINLHMLSSGLRE